MRGSSSADPSVPSQAAVSILESPHPVPSIPSSAGPSATAAVRDLPGMNEEEFSQKVFGIARFVQIAPSSVLMDMTVRLPPSSTNQTFNVYVSTTGNVVDPPRTTGEALYQLGRITPDKDGYGDLFKEVDGELWQWIGRGCVVQAATSGVPAGPAADAKPGSIFAGVVARSSGVWGNDKTVCACSGRTMWEEGREMEAKGML